MSKVKKVEEQIIDLGQSFKDLRAKHKKALKQADLAQRRFNNLQVESKQMELEIAKKTAQITKEREKEEKVMRERVEAEHKAFTEKFQAKYKSDHDKAKEQMEKQMALIQATYKEMMDYKQVQIALRGKASYVHDLIVQYGNKPIDGVEVGVMIDELNADEILQDREIKIEEKVAMGKVTKLDGEIDGLLNPPQNPVPEMRVPSQPPRQTGPGSVANPIVINN